MNPTDREIYKHGTPEERANIRDDAIDERAEEIYREIFSTLFSYAKSDDIFYLAHSFAEKEFDDLEESYRHDVPY